MEAHSEAATVPRPSQGTPIREVIRRFLNRYGLIAFLALLPAYAAVDGLINDHNLVRVSDDLVTGLSNGAIWALIAIGYTLVYGIIELINFAHGDVFMLGSFISAGLYGTLGLTLTTGSLGVVGGLAVCLVVAMLVCGFLNVCIERVAYRPLRSAPKLAPLITAVGFSFILQNVGLLWLGGSPASVPDVLRQDNTLFTLLGVHVSRGELLAIGITIPLVFGMAAFINNSRLGKAMRATAQDPEAARLMGVNVDTTISLTFLIGGMLAGAAGLVFALYETTIWYFQGFRGGLFAFTAAVMGGIGNVRGAVMGGLLIGVVQAISDASDFPGLGPEWTDAVVFAFLIIVMIFRPQGLLGEETREAG